MVVTPTEQPRKSWNLLTPAVSLMNRLKYPQKFALISLLFAILLGTVMFLLISEINDRIEFTQKEIYGDAYLRPLRRLFEHATESSRLAHAYALGDVALRPELIRKQADIDEEMLSVDKVQQEYGEILKTEHKYEVLKENWRFLRMKSLSFAPADNKELYAKFLADILGLISYVGDTSNLILDPDLDSYYLMDAVLLKLPEGLDRIARTRDFGENILRRGTITPQEKAELIVLIGLLRSNSEAINNGLKVAFHNNPAGNLKPVLDEPLQDLTALARQTLKEIETQVINSETIQIDSKTYVDSFTLLLNEYFSLWDRIVVELDGLLEVRIDGFESKKKLVLTLSILILVLVFYLLVGFYRAVMHTVHSLEEAAQRMVLGDMAATVSLQTRDELGQVVTSFNSIASGLLEAQEKYRSIFENAVEGIFQSRPDGRFISVNPAMCRIFGYVSEEEMLANVQNISQQLYVEADRRREFMRRMEEQGAISHFESQAFRKDRSLVWISEKVHAVRGEDGSVLYFEGSIEEITDRKIAEKQLKQKTDLLKVLQEVSTAANQATSEEEALQIGVDRVCEFTGWPVGHVYLRSVNSGEELIPTTIWHLASPERFKMFRKVTEAMTLKSGTGLPGRVLESGKPVWIMDIMQDTNFPRAKASKEIGVRAAFGFPVMVGSQVVAVMEFFMEQPVEPDEPLLQAMAHIGTQLGRVFERKQAEVELRKAKERAEESDRSKSKFLATMSHELRTPLNAIIGYSEMLQEEAADLNLKDFIPDLGRIQSAGKHLLNLINDILDLSKIEAGKMDLYLETFDIAALIQEVTQTIHPLAEMNSNKLKTEVADNIGQMHSDLTRVRQILFNLLSNACKFTKNGTVRLQALREQQGPTEMIRFEVADTGIGMSSEQLAKLFQAFSQADASTTRKYGGTGLGLVISQKFCQMMKGNISAQGEPGKGSTFTVRLPAVIAEEAYMLEQPKLDEKPAAERSITGRGGAESTILVIDDDADARELIARMLSKEGFRSLIAGSGEEGLRLAQKFRPQAITLDVMMPGMDGWAVLAELKADPQTASIPVIMVTMVENKEMGYSFGASDYVTKPIDRERFAMILSKYRCANPPCPVLIVEDDVITRDMLKRMLEKDGWSVEEAENGRTGLEKVMQHLPELILLDLMMPEMDGFEFLAELRKNEAWRRIPLIVVTAKELTHEDHTRLNGYVQKILQKGAFTQEQLLTDMRSLLEACVALPENRDSAQT